MVCRIVILTIILGILTLAFGQACDFGTYGQNCRSICPAMCFGGGCDTVTGNCPNGCLAGWKGDQCTISDKNNEKEERPVSFVMAVIIGSVVFTILLLGIVCSVGCCRTGSQKRGKRKKPYQDVFFTPTSCDTTRNTTSPTYDSFQFQARSETASRNVSAPPPMRSFDDSEGHKQRRREQNRRLRPQRASQNTRPEVPDHAFENHGVLEIQGISVEAIDTPLGTVFHFEAIEMTVEA